MLLKKNEYKSVSEKQEEIKIIYIYIFVEFFNSNFQLKIRQVLQDGTNDEFMNQRSREFLRVDQRDSNKN